MLHAGCMARLHSLHFQIIVISKEAFVGWYVLLMRAMTEDEVSERCDTLDRSSARRQQCSAAQLRHCCVL